MIDYVLHRADSRGFANHGWLKSFHSFSFANYFNPERMRFGTLRVLNDDTIAPSMGFDTHPHENMEIISIPLDGELEHKDSMGNISVIKKGEIQVMSAGTGILHSEYNHSDVQFGKFLQIWVFPKIKNVEPRYDQITISEEKNKLHQILSPDKDDAGVWIHQNAWFHIGKFDEGMPIDYKFKLEANGAYIFVISGELKIDEFNLNQRDALGIFNIDKFKIRTITDSEFLIMEVPMTL